MPCRTQVEDGEAPVAEGGPGPLGEALAVGAAALEGAEHGYDALRGRAAGGDDAGDAAHQRGSVERRRVSGVARQISAPRASERIPSVKLPATSPAPRSVKCTKSANAVAGAAASAFAASTTTTPESAPTRRVISRAIESISTSVVEVARG